MPTTTVALLIVLFFGVPGFITQALISSSITRRQRNAQEWVAEVMVFSAFNLLPTALVYGLLIWLNKVPPPDFSNFPPKNPPLLTAIIIYAVCFIILPAVIGMVLVVIYNQGWLKTLYQLLGVNYIHPEPRAWDAYFSQRKQRGVVVTLTDGTKIAGYMGNKSFAATYPAQEDLYLEAVYLLKDGNLTPDPMPNTGGIWIAGSQIRYLEFYVPKALKEKE